MKGYKVSKEYISKISLKIEEEFIKTNIKINQIFSSSNIEKDSRRKEGRKEDTLCRYGGDEFVVLLPNMVVLYLLKG